MELKKFKLIPAVLALSMMMVPMAYAGADKAPDTQNETDKVPNPPNKAPEPTNKVPNPPDKSPNPPSRPNYPSYNGKVHHGGGGNSTEVTIACRIGNRMLYTASWRQCKELRYSMGYGQVRRTAKVVVQGGGCNCDGSMGYATGGYGNYQPQRVIRYVSRPSRAAQMQAEKRARRAAQAYGNGYGYGDGGMVGYGNGVMVGGYGNNVVVNGSVYGGNGYAYGDQQIVVKHKRKHKRSRRVIYQEPMIYGNAYGYDDQGPTMYKGGGY